MHDNDERASDKSVPGDAAHERLDSWKEIAAYLGRGVTTVQRWEQSEGLPVRRLPHAKRGSVFAFKPELDAWRVARSAVSAPEEEGLPSAITVPPDDDASHVARRSRRLALPIVGAATGLLMGLATVWSLTTADRDELPRVRSQAVMKPIANSADVEEGPSLSPDGTELVFRWQRSTGNSLYVKGVDSGELRQLPVGDVRLNGHPRWSPRGDLIAFLAFEGDSGRAIYVIAPDGTGLRRVTSTSGVGLCWAADGQSLGFVDWNVNGEPLSIFKISLKTGERTRLTTPPAGSFGDTHCAFSSDGRLGVARFFTRSQADVFIVGSDSSGNEVVDRLTFDFDGIEGLTWAPGDRDMVFGAHSGLWRVAVDGDLPRRPVRVIEGFEKAHPSFSRPGAGGPVRLAFNSDIIDVNLWRSEMGEDQMFSSRKVEGSLQWETHPALAPDERRLAFASSRTGHNEIWTANLDGSDARQVTFHRGPMVVSPRWSPSGDRLAYSAQVAGNRDIYVVRLDGSRATRLTWEPSQEENPSWSRDGQWIYFRSDRGGVGQIWKVAATGGAASRVTEGAGAEAFESFDGRLLYFVRSWDVPGVWAIPIRGGTEVQVVPNVNASTWGVAEAGLAFFAGSPRVSPEGPTIRFFDFKTGQTSVVGRLPVRGGSPHQAASTTEGFATARDGRSFYWTRTDRRDRDVMLIDDWR